MDWLDNGNSPGNYGPSVKLDSSFDSIPGTAQEVIQYYGNIEDYPSHCRNPLNAAHPEILHYIHNYE